MDLGQSSFSSSIRKFNGSDYEVWSALIKAVLVAKNQAYVLREPRPAESKESTKWDHDNQAAKAKDHTVVGVRHG